MSWKQSLKKFAIDGSQPIEYISPFRWWLYRRKKHCSTTYPVWIRITVPFPSYASFSLRQSHVAKWRIRTILRTKVHWTNIGLSDLECWEIWGNQWMHSTSSVRCTVSHHICQHRKVELNAPCGRLETSSNAPLLPDPVICMMWLSIVWR